MSTVQNKTTLQFRKNRLRSVPCVGNILINVNKHKNALKLISQL